MRLFNRSFSYCLVLCGLPLLFIPKINLLNIGARETAGMRLDDLVLLAIFILIFWAHFALRKTLNTIERSMLAVVFLSLLSFALNRLFVQSGWIHVDASFFYCVRIIEYFTFFYIGTMSLPFFNPSSLIRLFFLWNVALMFLQKADLIGQFTLGGYVSSSEGRVTGIASFPSEAGMLLDLAFCYLVYPQEKSHRFAKLMPAEAYSFFSKTYVYWLFLLCSTLVIITGSRIAILALVVVFLFRIKEDLKKASVATWLYGLAFVAAGAAITTIMILKTDSVAARSAGLFSFKNLELIETIWNNINLSHDPIGNESVKYEAYDMSWWMRAHKWVYAFKIYCLHPECWLQGVGPGFAMAALDGGWLRLLTENGLIGLALYCRLFFTIARQSEQLWWMMVAFAINMIFFDVYLAYKPMSLLFFVSGCAWVEAQDRIPIRRFG